MACITTYTGKEEFEYIVSFKLKNNNEVRNLYRRKDLPPDSPLWITVKNDKRRANPRPREAVLYGLKNSSSLKEIIDHWTHSGYSWEQCPRADDGIPLNCLVVSGVPVPTDTKPKDKHKCHCSRDIIWSKGCQCNGI